MAASDTLSWTKLVPKFSGVSLTDVITTVRHSMPLNCPEQPKIVYELVGTPNDTPLRLAMQINHVACTVTIRQWRETKNEEDWPEAVWAAYAAALVQPDVFQGSLTVESGPGYVTAWLKMHAYFLDDFLPEIAKLFPQLPSV
jgi:hypothetical protein